ncbi:hypothetical protein Acr_17g0007570 [Actinidia rufa]|uniref:Uncharacterized protein n=1 Tax=Actinidia rufa TaxID=165716 RepID=A0A7J0G323_9ERIC|nr:hypothetical protein Acr_17g0007570 [Actinidia rufa]
MPVLYQTKIVSCLTKSVLCRAKPRQLSCLALTVPCCVVLGQPSCRARGRSDHVVPQLIPCPKRAHAGFIRAVLCRQGPLDTSNSTPLDLQFQSFISTIPLYFSSFCFASCSSVARLLASLTSSFNFEFSCWSSAIMTDLTSSSFSNSLFCCSRLFLLTVFVSRSAVLVLYSCCADFHSELQSAGVLSLS